MSNEKPVELTEAEREGLIDAIQDGTEDAFVARIKAAARREALLEARGEVQRRMDDAELADGGKLQTWDALASVIEWIEEKA